MRIDSINFSSFAIAIVLIVAVLSAQQAGAPAKLLQNGEFESDLAGWSFVADAGARGSVRLFSDQPLSERTPHSLRIEATELGTAQTCGAANSGIAGISVVNGDWFDAVFCARTDEGRGLGLLFSLETPDGKHICARTTLPEVGRGGIGVALDGTDAWRRYSVSLHAHRGAPQCRLVISPIETGVVFLDDVSMTLRSPLNK